jgi:NAD(P)-dependent dehydrogenase (short-subunit alcohol dehydrogenase family)
MGVGLETLCGCELDVSNRRSVEAFVREHGDCIDLVINNAAVCPTGWNAATIRECWRINVLGPLVLTRALLPGMLRRRRGHILHVSSGDGELVYLHTSFEAALRNAASERAVLRVLARAAPPRNAFGHAPAHGLTPAYAASKAALNALTRIGASQLPKADKCGVCISAVCPGDVNTRMLSDHDPQARLRALPPAIAARGVLRVAACGLDPAANAFPSGRFWRHSREIDV